MTGILKQLTEITGSEGLLTGADIGKKYHADGSGESSHAPLAVLRPKSTEEVSALLRICSATEQKIVIQGGLTGLCGGATPGE